MMRRIGQVYYIEGHAGKGSPGVAGFWFAIRNS